MRAYRLGLIGYPIQHSLSPWIHEQFLKRNGLTGSYELYEVAPESDFAQEVEKLKAMELDGWNITVPYKEKILPYLDEIDVSAKQIGAVNTVVRKNGRYIGYNTDGTGYVRSLLHHHPRLKENKSVEVLLLGAGGAAKGIYHALLASGFSNLTVANRTTEKATAIVNESTEVATLSEVEASLNQFRLIIQTTNVGMKPDINNTVISLKQLQPDAVVSDIVYQPLETKLLLEAKKAGAYTHYGHTMLLYQAQYAFEIWTGHLTDTTNMDTKLQAILEG